nr:hypothetical protein Cduv_247 [Cedratvirus duvanny]
MSVLSLLTLSFRKLYSSRPEDALQLAEMGLDLPWSVVADKEFFDLGLRRGLNEKERFMEIVSYRVFSDLTSPILYDQDTLQLERFRVEEEIEELPKHFVHSIAFYRENFALGWRTFPYKSIVHHFLPSFGLEDLLQDPVLVNFYNQDNSYVSFLSLYQPLHYLLSSCSLEDIKNSGVKTEHLCRALELKIIYNQEPKEAFQLLSSFCKERGYLERKVKQALLVHGNGVVQIESISDVSALTFSCRYNHLNKMSCVDLFLNAFEGWLYHRNLEDFYYTTKTTLQSRIGKLDRIKICQFSRALPVDIVDYLLTLMEEKVYFLKGVLRNNKGYLATVRFCENKLKELAS